MYKSFYWQTSRNNINTIHCEEQILNTWYINAHHGALRLVKCGFCVIVHEGTLLSINKVCSCAAPTVVSGGFIPLEKADL